MSKEPNRKLSDQYMLRLPDGLRDRIKQAAEKNGRSMNTEIVLVLLESFPEKYPYLRRVTDWDGVIYKILSHEPGADITEVILGMFNEQRSAYPPDVLERYQDELAAFQEAHEAARSAEPTDE